MNRDRKKPNPLKTFADFFCGVGAFHVAASRLGLDCVFACDIDREARIAYRRNFGLSPAGDVTRLHVSEVPDHDCFFAGFPCQPFSIIGRRRGFADAKNGSLFLEAARIIAAKRPPLVVLENVRQLATANGGKYLRAILCTLEAMGYDADWRILNALDFGLPQKRERIIIVGSLLPLDSFVWPEGGAEMRPLAELLEKEPDRRHFVSERIRRSRHEKHRSAVKPSIWHENKGGNVNSHPFSCALRAGASYNYLLVDGERRLTPREMFRLQGFPDSFVLSGTDAQSRRLAGNAVPVPMVESVLEEAMNVYGQSALARQPMSA